MTNYFQAVLESSSLTSSKCYLKCIEYPDAKNEFKKQKVPKICDPKKWWNKGARYCPEEDKDVACQLECLTMQ
jgi:hypothetical protein